MADAHIERLLKTDALSLAEKITGNDYKNDDATTALGMLIQMQRGAELDKALTAAGDTTFSNELDRYQEIITGHGFEEVLCIPFVSSHRGRNEKFFAYARRDGLLLCFDTFGGDHVNGGSLYYQIRPTDKDALWKAISSGSMKDDVWCGHHDCREALLHNIGKLSRAGEFLPKWEHTMWLWLLHHEDTKADGYDYDAINAERIAMLPEWVREMLGPNAAQPHR